jgi:hypothetical protein
LLEVLIALAIFLLAMVVFGQMIIYNASIATSVERQNLATRLCQRKLAEVVSGAQVLESAEDQAFDDEPDYHWSLDAEPGEVEGLWDVTVHVVYSNDAAGGLPVEISLSQLVLDPSVAGNTQDVTAVDATDTSSSSGSTGSSSAGTSGATGGTTPTTPAATGGAGAGTTPNRIGGGTTPTAPTTPSAPSRTTTPTAPTTPGRTTTPSRGS